MNAWKAGRRTLVLLFVCIVMSDATGARAAAATDWRVAGNVAYGTHTRHVFDVYAAPGVRDAPVILMVHGGGWRIGDKTHANSIDGKIAHWVPRGVVFVATNYRLLPDADPREQAEDVARALATVQERVHEWGGDGSRLVLMGHSAGAHLVSLVAADAKLRALAKPWLATISLDTASLDVLETMRGRHLPLYDRAFGDDAGFWRTASPLAQLDRGAGTFLLVCSTRRSDACPQGEAFARKARALGLRAQTLGFDFSHAGINGELGVDAAYTAAVDAFLASIDGGFAARADEPAEP
jgi:arylformamidase